ncbi:unnamed protein product [Owenia fusiformis]|uniref:Sodium/nucleoside cotransporter n=1 Tax=Owenia fusiformis TaxID=6347 RepID=A0A8J1Y7X6_OWEFU|nr:unnamed protein product [Owenia fusiformis]
MAESGTNIELKTTNKNGNLKPEDEHIPKINDPLLSNPECVLQLTDDQENTYAQRIEALQNKWGDFLMNNAKSLWRIIYIILILLYSVYFGFAIWFSPKGATFLIVVTLLVVTSWTYSVISDLYGKRISKSLKDLTQPCSKISNKKWRYINWIIYGTLFIGVVLFLVFDTGRNPEQLTSFGGLMFFIFALYITSTRPAKVRARPVVWGLILQFLLGLFILRWSVGYTVFKFLGDQVQLFLNYADEGSKFVFGDPGYLMHVVAFKILPVVVFFSSFISILYYVGLMQMVIRKIAFLMQITMGTTAIESLSAAANIFLGQVETAVMLKPFIGKLTRSELHAVMTGGFATIAGTVVAAYIEFGAPAEHILSAAIMSAPAALAISKLGYPETEDSLFRRQDDIQLDKGPETNIIEAASNGAMNSIKLCAGVVVNLIAFISLLAFINACMGYLGGRVGYPELDFQTICSYLFVPLTLIMGVPWVDARKVARLIGTKIFLNEFLAYAALGPMIDGGELQERSAVIATYALCGFGSVAALGINLAALALQAPERKGVIAKNMIRAMISGNIACFMTACIAGILYQGQSFTDLSVANTTSTSTTVMTVH